MKKQLRASVAIVLFIALTFAAPVGRTQTTKQTVESGKRYARLVIRNATVIDGNGTPAAGPFDIVVEGNTITEIVGLDPVAVKSGTARRPAGDVEIDATGKYVMPGLINAHGHVQEERGGVAQPLDYELKLWLACGITTVRDVGSNVQKTLALKRASAAGEVAAPRLFVYAIYASGGAPKTAEAARQRVRDLKAQGVDGLKMFAMDRDLMAAAWDEARRRTPGTTSSLAQLQSNTGTAFRTRRLKRACRIFRPLTITTTKWIAFATRVACGARRTGTS
jgi:imidazolonepropionase-like amidohydrolase